MSENKKDPEGPFLYNYFFNVQFAYSPKAVNCVHRYITLFKYVVIQKYKNIFYLVYYIYIRQ